MAETDRDEKVAQAYRALGREEPPRALDAAILAAARRRPARWRVPLSLAAVLVLAVGVTLRMLPPEPGAESVALAPQVIETPRPATPPAAPAGKLEGSAPQPAAGARSPEDARGVADGPSRARVSAAATPPREAGEAFAARSRAEAAQAATEFAARRDAAAPATSEPPASGPAVAAAPGPRALASAKLAEPATPEAWLERIAELKKQGRAREAEESLAEFKKRYPGHKIPEALTR
jgi:hypothetical protein